MATGVTHTPRAKPANARDFCGMRHLRRVINATLCLPSIHLLNPTTGIGMVRALLLVMRSPFPLVPIDQPLLGLSGS